MVRDRAVPLSNSALQTGMNARGPGRYRSDLAQNARATPKVHTCACGAAKAAVQRLPEAVYGMLAHAVAFE